MKQQGIFILIYPVLIHVIKAMDIDRSPVQYATDSPLQANILMEMHAGTSNEVTSNVGKGTRLEEIKLDGITWTVSERTEIHKKRTNGCMRERERERQRDRERERGRERWQRLSLLDCQAAAGGRKIKADL